MDNPRTENSSKLIFPLAIFSSILLITIFIIETNKSARTQNQINIFPTFYEIDFLGDITWYNPEQSFIQDPSDKASLPDF